MINNVNSRKHVDSEKTLKIFVQNLMLSLLIMDSKIDIKFTFIVFLKTIPSTKLLFFGHFSFNRNNIQTAVTNMTKQRMRMYVEAYETSSH